MEPPHEDGGCGLVGRGGGGEEEDDESPCLTAYTLEALDAFLSQHRLPQLEQQQHQTQKREQNHDDEDHDNDDDEKQEQHHPLLNQELHIPSEDWRLSQFWYDEHTAFTLAQELYHLFLQTGSPVACIACPSLYLELKKSYPSVPTRLFEYDQRFQRYGPDFSFYDYNHPENLPSDFHHAFQVIVADPPYLSEECLEKTVQAMKLLGIKEGAFFILLTGTMQRDRALRLLGARPCAFRPSHQSKLGNDFTMYTNYDPDTRVGGWEHF